MRSPSCVSRHRPGPRSTDLHGLGLGRVSPADGRAEAVSDTRVNTDGDGKQGSMALEPGAWLQAGPLRSADWGWLSGRGGAPAGSAGSVSSSVALLQEGREELPRPLLTQHLSFFLFSECSLLADASCFICICNLCLDTWLQ